MKKSLVLLLVAVILCATIPFSVSAAGSTIYVGGVAMNDGDYLANDATSTTKTKPSESGYAYYKDGVLTLNGYSYTGEGYYYQFSSDPSDIYPSCIYSPTDLKILLVDISFLENTATNGECISVNGDLVIDGDSESGIQVDGYYGVYLYSSSKDVTFTFNDGIFYALGETGIQIDGYECSSDVIINGGLLAFETTSYSISVYADYNASFEMNGGEIGAMSDLIIYSYDANADITINHGALYVSSENIAVAAYTEAYNESDVLATVTLNGGDLYAFGSLCGVYGDEIYILGGEFRVGYDPETNPDGALYVGGITAVDGMGTIGTTLDSEYGIGVYAIGDVNADQKVDQLDYLVIKRACFGTYTLYGSENTRADIDANESVNATDYLLLKRICFDTYVAE